VRDLAGIGGAGACLKDGPAVRTRDRHPESRAWYMSHENEAAREGKPRAADGGFQPAGLVCAEPEAGPAQEGRARRRVAHVSVPSPMSSTPGRMSLRSVLSSPACRGRHAASSSSTWGRELLLDAFVLRTSWSQIVLTPYGSLFRLDGSGDVKPHTALQAPYSITLNETTSLPWELGSQRGPARSGENLATKKKLTPVQRPRRRAAHASG
jgi:hypothetical protein